MRNLVRRLGNARSGVAIGVVLMLGLATPSASAAVVGAPGAGGGVSPAATCVVTASTPYGKSGSAWYKATWSGTCSSIYVTLRWAKPFGTVIMDAGNNNVSGTLNSFPCAWGIPHNRNMYTRITSSTSGDSSSLQPLSDATSSCAL